MYNISCNARVLFIQQTFLPFGLITISQTQFSLISYSGHPRPNRFWFLLPVGSALVITFLRLCQVSRILFINPPLCYISPIVLISLKFTFPNSCFCFFIGFRRTWIFLEVASISKLEKLEAKLEEYIASIFRSVWFIGFFFFLSGY